MGILKLISRQYKFYLFKFFCIIIVSIARMKLLLSVVAIAAAQEGSGDEDLGIGARAFSAGNRNRGQAAAASDAADGERMGFNFGGNSFGGFDYGNYANYDLSGYDYGFDANAGRPDGEVDSDDRYFFTQPQAVTNPPGTVRTTIPPVLGSSCWKCDAMTFFDCAANGKYEECRLGDKDCCFIEVRATDQKLQQLCTGCKDFTACKDNMYENFNGRYDNDEQCRPEFIQQRYKGRHSGTQSVCRQCFKTCNPQDFKGAFCFGGIDGNNPAPDIAHAYPFSVPFETLPELLLLDLEDETTPSNPHFRPGGHYPFNSFFELGIPTWILVDDDTAQTAQFRINIETTRSNFFFGHQTTIAADGSEDFRDQLSSKVHSTDGTAGTYDIADMTYWSVQAGDRAWWMSDLKALQDRFFLLDALCTPSQVDGDIWEKCDDNGNGVPSFWGVVGGFDETGATIPQWRK